MLSSDEVSERPDIDITIWPFCSLKPIHNLTGVYAVVLSGLEAASAAS